MVRRLILLEAWRMLLAGSRRIIDMQIHSVGIDLGKTTSHLVALSAAGEVLLRKKFTQRQLITFTANLRCSLICMEAMGSRTDRRAGPRGAAGDRRHGRAAYVDQGYTGLNAAQQHGLRLEVVKHPMAKRGFVLLPRRWVVERSFAWAARFRRLARDYERLHTLKGLHLLAFATLMLRNLADTLK
jgi:transposase